MGGWMRMAAGALLLLGGQGGFCAPIDPEPGLPPMEPETAVAGRRELPSLLAQERGQVRPELRPFRVLAGLKVGHEGISRAQGVDGGSYLYAELSAFFGAYLGLNLKYSINLFPYSWHNHLAGLQSRFHIPLSRDLWSAVEVGYLLATDYDLPPEHFVGVTISPLYSGDLEGVSAELLPFSVYFNLRTGQVLLMIELLSLGFSFPH